MRSRLTKLGLTLAALAALAVGGASFATAAGQKPVAPPIATTPAETGAQQGDQSAADTADSQSEQPSSESSQSDGPGGYADTVANADTQQQGEH